MHSLIELIIQEEGGIKTPVPLPEASLREPQLERDEHMVRVRALVNLKMRYRFREPISQQEEVQARGVVAMSEGVNPFIGV